MFQSFRTAATTSARSLLAGHPTAARNTTAATTTTTATTTSTPAMASLSTTATSVVGASNFLPFKTTPTVEHYDTFELRRNKLLRHSEQTWEKYGFDRKECGWGAWYLVP